MTAAAQILCRPLWQALAHVIVNKRPGDPELEHLNRLYMRALSPADQLRCRAEMLEVREAKRGCREAEIAAEVEQLRTLLPDTPTERLVDLVLAFEGYEVVEARDIERMDL